MEEFYTSVEFYTQLALAVVLYRLLARGPLTRQIMLLVINFSFLNLLFKENPIAVLVTAGAILVTWLYVDIVLRVWPRATLPMRRFALTGLVGLLIGILAYCKYSPLVVIGISYLTFKLIHFASDSFSGQITDRRFLTFINYTSFFAVFISGPIGRYIPFAEALERGIRSPSPGVGRLAAFRILLGVFKKVVLVSILATRSISTMNADALAASSFGGLSVAAFAFTFLMYFDFSGYCDLAIGVSCLLGLNTPENFRSPYLSQSIQEFWTRWHISLSEWIRDYIFYPLLKWWTKLLPNASGAWLPSLAIFVAFALSGIWHGNGANYLIWGASHGAALSGQNFYREYMRKGHKQRYAKLKVQKSYRLACWSLTFLYILVVNVVFALDIERLAVIGKKF